MRSSWKGWEESSSKTASWLLGAIHPCFTAGRALASVRGLGGICISNLDIGFSAGGSWMWSPVLQRSTGERGSGALWLGKTFITGFRAHQATFYRRIKYSFNFTKCLQSRFLFLLKMETPAVEGLRPNILPPCSPLLPEQSPGRTSGATVGSRAPPVMATFRVM